MNEKVEARSTGRIEEMTIKNGVIFSPLFGCGALKSLVES